MKNNLIANVFDDFMFINNMKSFSFCVKINDDFFLIYSRILVIVYIVSAFFEYSCMKID